MHTWCDIRCNQCCSCCPETILLLHILLQWLLQHVFTALLFRGPSARRSRACRKSVILDQPLELKTNESKTKKLELQFQWVIVSQFFANYDFIFKHDTVVCFFSCSYLLSTIFLTLRHSNHNLNRRWHWHWRNIITRALGDSTDLRQSKSSPDPSTDPAPPSPPIDNIWAMMMVWR